jgi:hypothetical protein
MYCIFLDLLLYHHNPIPPTTSPRGPKDDLRERMCPFAMARSGSAPNEKGQKDEDRHRELIGYLDVHPLVSVRIPI